MTEREKYKHAVAYADLKAMLEAGESFRAIGAKYGLSHERIRQIYLRYCKDMKNGCESESSPRVRAKARAVRKRLRMILDNETLFDIKSRCEHYKFEFNLVAKAAKDYEYLLEVVSINRNLCRIYIIGHSIKHAEAAKTEYGKVNILAANLEKCDFIIVRNMVTNEYYIYPVSVFKPLMQGQKSVGFYIPMRLKRIQKSRKIEHEKYREAWGQLRRQKKRKA